MIKFPGVALAAALLIGSAASALAHDMSDMHMAETTPPKQSAATEPNTIEINNFTFGPATITVTAGTTVTWINHDDEPHTVVNEGTPRLFKSQALDTDDKFTFKFDKPGTYQYFCSIHPHMTGTVVVK